MPMTFTDEMVANQLERHGLSLEGAPSEKRDRLARYVEEKYRDYVEAWEIRTGRPWNQMTPDEAMELVTMKPELMRNPGVLSRLLS